MHNFNIDQIKWKIISNRSFQNQTISSNFLEYLNEFKIE